MSDNIDRKTVEGFGEEWAAFDQTALDGEEFAAMFEAYFHIFPFDRLPDGSIGFDLGCGSGRWASGVVDKVGTLHCIDPAEQALDVARRRLSGKSNVQFHLASSDGIPLADRSTDFGYSLGVLHHIPDTAKALRDCVAKLKVGAPFLVYLYYRFDTRPRWYRSLWQLSNLVRNGIFRLPFPARKAVTNMIAATVYWPLARSASLAEKLSLNVANLPLSAYRNVSFYTMRTDALDRFGTRLEHRFTRPEIETMMRQAGLTDITFSARSPFWVACGVRAA